MIKTNYGVIPTKMFSNYLEYLIGRVYKILCLQEEKDKNLYKYISSLQRELVGNLNLIENIINDGDFLCLLNKIEYLTQYHSEHKIVKKEIFECISLIKKLQKRYSFENHS